MRERKKKIFGFIEHGLWKKNKNKKKKKKKKKKRKPRSKKGKAPFKDRFLLFEMEHHEQEGGGSDRSLGSPVPHGPHKRVSVLSTLALRRLEFLSPWGGSILCFHHSIFMVTRFPLDEPGW